MNILKKLILIVSLIPLFLCTQAQYYNSNNNNIIGNFNSGILDFQGKTVTYDPLAQGRVLYLRASTISEDSLTYNSTGYLVTGSSGVNVDLDGSSEVLIGNSVRFGSPITGIIYHIVDTGATAANLVLDQTFTGSTSDEFYRGSVNTWYDESVYSNNLYQTTAINQPKLIWANTDSAEVNFDGVDDHLYFTNIKNIGKIFTIYIDFKFNYIDSYQDILSYSTIDSYRFNSSSHAFRINNTYYTTNYGFTDAAYKIISTRNELLYKIYISGVLINTKNLSISDNTDFRILSLGARSLSTIDLGFNGAISNINIYNRVLTSQEIQLLSQ